MPVTSAEDLLVADLRVGGELAQAGVAGDAGERVELRHELRAVGGVLAWNSAAA